jgi:hypothetical protein
MDVIYHKFLWFCGFAEGEHISDMLARQKQRLGLIWWFFPILTIIGFLGFTGWLFWHIATFKLKGGK